MTKPLHAVAETQIYLSRAENLMSGEERAAVVDLLAASPQIGDLIPGTGGGARIIYYIYDETLPVYLLFAYAKNERDDLSSEQKAVLRRLVEAIVAGRRQ